MRVPHARKPRPTTPPNDPPPPHSPPRPPARSRYRTELQGLRALAAVLVVLYHVWFDRISGGVDVFFFISGFLITGQLFRTSLRGRIEFGPLWGRMIKRLFPAALTVLLVTTVLAIVLLPERRWFSTIAEVVASALYVENWRLAADSVDYFAQHDTASVVQQFWSLSVQGQFYLVWPLLMALLVWLARAAGRSLRGTLIIALSVVFAGSLAYSVWLTAANQPLAYFSSLTRIWEFALGGLFALTIDALVLPRIVRVVAGWLGVVGLIACGLVLQVGTVFPGYAALWPTLSAALVLVAGATGSAVGADRLLSARPLVRLGDLSYSLYLWHWPVLLFYLITTEQASPGWVGGAVVIGISVLLAVPTYHFVETPVRESRIGVTTRWGAYRFAALALAPVLVVVSGWHVVAEQRATYPASADSQHPPGAEVLRSLRADSDSATGAEPAAAAALVDSTMPIVPPFVALKDQFDWFTAEDCTISSHHEALSVCFIEPDGEPTRRVVVAGDSHSQQFNAALRPIVEQRGWQVIAMGRGSCPLSTDSDTVPVDEVCREWNEAVIAEILDIRPDAVLTIGTRDVRVGLTEWTPPGYLAQWRRLAAADIPVVAIRDNPRFDFSPPECVERHGADSPRCAVARSEILAPDPPYHLLPDVPPNVSFVDFSDYYCTPEVCPPVIGNVLVYMDNNHISRAYMATMSDIVAERLEQALGWQDTPVVAPEPTR